MIDWVSLAIQTGILLSPLIGFLLTLHRQNRATLARLIKGQHKARKQFRRHLEDDARFQTEVLKTMDAQRKN